MTKKERFNSQGKWLLVIRRFSNLVLDRADVRQSHPLRWLFVKLDKIRRFLLFWAGSECKGFRFLLLLMTQRERTVGFSAAPTALGFSSGSISQPFRAGL